MAVDKSQEKIDNWELRKKYSAEHTGTRIFWLLVDHDVGNIEIVSFPKFGSFQFNYKETLIGNNFRSLNI